MLIQVITVEGGKRPAHEIQALGARLRTAGHEVVVHRFAAAAGYRGRSGRDDAIVNAIWESDRACFRRARERAAPWTLVLEEDCEIEDVEGIAVAERFVTAHPGEVDVFFLGASPNCWWRPTGAAPVVRYSHVYWWHAVVFTASFWTRFDGPRTWHGANDVHFCPLIASGEVRAYGLRRQAAFQRDRRCAFSERVLYAWPWGDGRLVAGAALALAAVWALARPRDGSPR